MAGILRKTIRVLKWGIIGGTVAGSTIVLYRNDWDVSSVGAVRFGRAALAAAIVAVDYKWTLGWADCSSSEYPKIKSELHLRAAKRLREMCCVNRGCFIKVGQHIGALEYLLPLEYVNTFKVLHDRAPQSTKEELYQVLREEFHKEVDEVFNSFSPEPLGAASLAQVHKATLKDGRVVAVKVQHPKVKAHSFVDIATMEFLVNVISWLFPEFHFQWLADETKKNLPLELDFLYEGRNCERVARIFSKFDFLKVPEIYWDLSTERVLTMEYCEGGKISDRQYMLDNGISISEVVKNVGKLYSEMIYVQGYVHCDPHPGNVLVKKTTNGPQIVLLDHGLYVTLTDEFRLNYSSLWLSLIRRDLDGIKYYGQQLGAGPLVGLFACMVTARSWKAVTTGIDKGPVTEAETQDIKMNAAQYMAEITQLLGMVPREMLLILKTNDLIRAIEYSLQLRATKTSFITMSRCCVRAVYQYKRKQCSGYIRKFQVSLREQLELLRISMYELFLWIASSNLVQWIKGERISDQQVAWPVKEKAAS